MKYVMVIFESGYQGKEYAYKSFLDLKEGDLVVVEANSTLSIARVSKISEYESRATKYVVSKVDLDTFNLLKAKAKAEDALIKKLNERRTIFEEQRIWEYLAKEDKITKNLLDELRKLRSGE